MKAKLLFIVSSLFFSVSLASGQGGIKMVFRYDDYLLVPSKFSDSLLNIFQKNNIPLCLGIIPFDSSDLFINKLNPDQVTALRSRIQRREIEVALHGFNHRNELNVSFLTRVTYSEFASIAYDKQYEKIAKGKKALDSLFQINTRVFVPPFNTYDNNTLKALDKLKFEIISSSLQGPSNSNLIKYMPATCEDFSELPRIIENSKGDDVTIILFFHPYSFKEGLSKYSKDLSKLMTINQLDTLLNWVKKQKVNFYTFSELAKIENFNKALYQTNTVKYNLFKKTLNRLKLYHYGIYSTIEFRKLNIELLFGNVILHLLSFLFVYFFVYYVIKILRPNLKMILILLGICSLPIFIYLFYIRNDFSFAIILIILSVNLAALILILFRIHKSLNTKISRQ